MGSGPRCASRVIHPLAPRGQGRPSGLLSVFRDTHLVLTFLPKSVRRLKRCPGTRAAPRPGHGHDGDGRRSQAWRLEATLGGPWAAPALSEPSRGR